ncbi:helix-turn-helix domain-containing protein [Staphylococcus warneri]|uniref:helix-turn-helix domain-containing protein n=1 Tax=Staphylococcus warneri TaxID=1292 RepID=UPI001A294C8B|nr:helix-turn-helix domain-containing protein [Staphylococcus warneri]MBJ7884465.1 helix-turn-helix domain-containing protein [Bacillaceae bacterium HSR45]MCJ1787578.1 helix-turn-helix domain-containing protein [Staphylococcus warneri]MCJ1790070.1 helix-turn-helix domain-containing protein [Staphylococcus warneri]MCJ1792469.1 helix-turn-helix domain-containing protein [Staphylococcus warneri]MCJ1794957.1 helix-turn-helix domain-containing protein [Staphylococcus warneri]
MPRTKMRNLPTMENTALAQEQIVFPIKYAKPKLLGEIFNCSYSTIRRLLISYDEDDLGIENLYMDISSTLTLVNVEKFEQFLQKKHKKYL